MYEGSDKMDTLKVLHDNALVHVKDETEDLGNGLNIDAKNSSRRKIVKGKVILANHTLKVGDTVYFPLYAGDEISYKGSNYLVINIADVKLVEEE